MIDYVFLERYLVEAVNLTRQEPGLSIRDIARIFKTKFSPEELQTLLKELQK